MKNLFLVVCFSAASLFAQTTPTLVIEDSLRTIGGRKEIAKIRSIHAFADCAGPNGRYITEIYSAKNARLIFKQVRENGNAYFEQTNGQIFWTKEDKTGDFTLADNRAAFAWTSHDYQWLAMKIATRFRDLTLAGEENFAGKTAVKLRAKDELGNPANVFFDRDSKLMRGFTIQNPFSAQPEQIRTVFNDWKQVRKLKLPSKVTMTDNQGDFVLNFREISLNKTDESVFTVPAKVTAMNELMKLQKQQRAAHFNPDARIILSEFADEFISVGNGKVQKPDRQAGFNRLQNYFNNSTFIEWDDITPPIIKVSDDATLGYVIVHKRVRLLAKDQNEKEAVEVFKKNVENYPNSANVYDSLGEAYEKNGQFKQARDNYEKAYKIAETKGDAQLAQIAKANFVRVSNKIK